MRTRVLSGQNWRQRLVGGAERRLGPAVAWALARGVACRGGERTDGDWTEALVGPEPEAVRAAVDEGVKKSWVREERKRGGEKKMLVMRQGRPVTASAPTATSGLDHATNINPRLLLLRFHPQNCPKHPYKLIV